MRNGPLAALGPRLRRADPTARLLVEAQAETAADLRQTADDWNAADSLTGLTVLADGGVQLTAGATVVAQQPTQDAWFSNLAPLTNATIDVAVIGWTGAEPGDMELTSLTAYLNPKLNAGQDPVYYWELRLFQPVSVAGGVSLQPLSDPVRVKVSGTTAADVQFTFDAARRPRPKAQTTPLTHPLAKGANTVVVISALNRDGSASTNGAWGTRGSLNQLTYTVWQTSAVTLSGNIGSADTVINLSGPPPYGFVALPGVSDVAYYHLENETIAAQVSAANSAQLVNVQRGVNGTTAVSHASGVNLNVGPTYQGNTIYGVKLTAGLIQAGTPGTVLYTYTATTPGGVPRLTVNTGSYAAATLQFSGVGNELNLGSTPANTVELVGRADVPTGAAVTYQVLKDGGNPANNPDWLTYTDGMLTSDPALGGLVSLRQTYQLRAQLAPDSTGALTPTLRQLGVRALTRTPLWDVAEVTRGDWAFDPLTLKGEIGEFQITAMRDGARDYHDAITRLLATTAPWSAAGPALLFALFWGDPTRPRSEWLHVDDLLYEDHDPQAATIVVTAVACTALIKQALPKFNATTLQRTPLAYPNASVTPATTASVYADLLANQLGDVFPKRWQGPTLPALAIPVPPAAGGAVVSNSAANPTVLNTGTPHGQTGTFAVVIGGSPTDTAILGSWTATVVDTTHFSIPVSSVGGTGGTWFTAGGSATTATVAKTITATPTSTPGQPEAQEDAKLELDALAYLAGYTLLSSQGRVKPIACLPPPYGPVQPLVGVLDPGELQPVSVLPGLRQRVAETWVPWGWDGNAYPFTAYALNNAALASLGNAFIDPQPVRDEIARWIPAQTGDPAFTSSLANWVAGRIVELFGAGLMLWSFTTTYAHPEWEPGDLVAIPTDWFVARDPVAGVALAGQLWAAAIVQRAGVDAKTFTVWVRSYTDVLTQGQIATLPGFGAPAVVSAPLTVGATGSVSVVIHTTGAAAVKYAVSAAGYPTAATVAAAAIHAPDANGNLSATGITTLAAGQTAYLAVLAYQMADASDAGSTLFQASVAAPSLPVNSLLSVTAIVRANHLVVAWMGNTGVASVKVAFNKVSFPAAGTGTAYAGQTGTVDLGAFLWADLAYVTVTPYDAAGGTGNQGPAVNLNAQLPVSDTLVDPGDGKVHVSTALIPQGSVAPAGVDGPVGYQTGGPSSGAMWIIWTPQSVTLTYSDGTTDSMGAFAYPTPPTPSLSQVAGGTLGARTYSVRIGYVKDGAICMKHNAVSATLAVNANNLLQVASPASQAGFDGYVVFVSTTAGAEVCQNMSGIVASPVAFGTNWTEPTGGVTTAGTKYSDMNATLAGAVVPCFINLATSTPYYFFPYWDQSLSAAFFADGVNTAKTTAAAIAQAADGKTPLSTASINVTTPGGAGSSSGTLGGTGTCIAAGQLVETRHGIVPIETVVVGDEIAGRTGWTRVVRARHLPTEDFVRVRLEDGAEVIVTPEHPFTVPGELAERARDLTVDSVLHTRTGYGRVVGISLEPAAGCPKVVLTCEPEHEFWAGSEAPTVLVHNTQVVS